MIELRISLEGAELEKLAAFPKQARFAVVKSLTLTAKDAQAALKAEAPGVFHLRNTWVPQGIRIDPATSGSMSARVGSIDRYMGRHVHGDPKPAGRALSIRSKRDGNGRLATGGLLIAPYSGIGSAPKHQVVRRKLGRIGSQKKKTFQIMGRGSGKVLIVRRTSKKRRPLQVVAILSALVAEHPIWKMDRTVSGVVSARFGTHFAAALDMK